MRYVISHYMVFPPIASIKLDVSFMLSIAHPLLLLFSLLLALFPTLFHFPSSLNWTSLFFIPFSFLFITHPDTNALKVCLFYNILLDKKKNLTYKTNIRVKDSYYSVVGRFLAPTISPAWCYSFGYITLCSKREFADIIMVANQLNLK